MTTMSKNGNDFDYSDDEFEFDEEYFSRTYRPLSNLPTPPPSSRHTSVPRSPRSTLGDGELLDSALLGLSPRLSLFKLYKYRNANDLITRAGPAVHLVNLIPPTASLTTPSIPVVHEILTRADLPLETIALAVCILDSLDSKFSLSWRLVCPLVPYDSLSSNSKRYTIPATILAHDELHIDSVRPELIILASLVIAVKFLEDCQQSTDYYRSIWGEDLWTCDQINATERCIMERLAYRILPLWDAELIDDALGDMRRAAKEAVARGGWSHERENPVIRPMSSGEAVCGVGMQLTPVETPVSEDVAYERSPEWVNNDDDNVRAAFMSGSSALISHHSLQLPAEGRGGSLPLVEGFDYWGISA